VALAEAANVLCEDSAGDQLFRQMQQKVAEKTRQQASERNKRRCEGEPGMHWDESTDRCSKNVCTCQGAASAVGASCKVSGTEKCDPSQAANCSSIFTQQGCPVGTYENKNLSNHICKTKNCDDDDDYRTCCVDNSMATNLKLTVKTKDEKSCGTKRNKIYAQLFGTSGSKTPNTLLGGKDQNLAKGSTHEFIIPSKMPLVPSQICLTLEKDRQVLDDWCPQSVQVYNADTNTLIGSSVNWPDFTGTNQQKCKPIMSAPR